MCKIVLTTERAPTLIPARQHHPRSPGPRPQVLGYTAQAHFGGSRDSTVSLKRELARERAVLASDQVAEAALTDATTMALDYQEW
jgi:hypothetical protein